MSEFTSDNNLKSLVEIGYIFETLGVSASDSVCSIVDKGLKQVNQDLPHNVFYLAEIKRIFNCKVLDKLDTTIQTVLKDKSISEPTELYFAYLLNKNAQIYGAKSSPEFTKTLTEKTTKEILDMFKAEDFSYNLQGFSIESLRVVRLLTAINNT